MNVLEFYFVLEKFYNLNIYKCRLCLSLPNKTSSNGYQWGNNDLE